MKFTIDKDLTRAHELQYVIDGIETFKENWKKGDFKMSDMDFLAWYLGHGNEDCGIIGYHGGKYSELPFSGFTSEILKFNVCCFPAGTDFGINSVCFHCDVTIYDDSIERFFKFSFSFIQYENGAIDPHSGNMKEFGRI